MSKFLRLCVSAIVAVAALCFGPLAQTAAAQDVASAVYGSTRVYVGGGFQYLTLPDVKFTGKGDPDNFRFQRNSDFSNYSWATGGGIETKLGYWGAAPVTFGVKGFWSSLDDDEVTRCKTSTCIAPDPAGGPPAFGPPVLVTKTTRDVDYWGGQAEAKFWSPNTNDIKPNFYRNDYFIVGADIRGIDQDIHLRGRFEGDPIYTYRETLDTTYYGGYIGIGGEYSFGFIPGIKNVGGLYDRLGLRTYISARAGLYDAQTDYSGRYALQFTPFNSRASRSDDEIAFIGTISLETRKQIGARTSLSLFSDYEYISSVPKMRYSDGDRPTQIDSEGAFATRTMLRLNIALGGAPAPAPAYYPSEPLK